MFDTSIAVCHTAKFILLFTTISEVAPKLARGAHVGKKGLRSEALVSHVVSN